MCVFQYGLDRILGEEKSLTLLAQAIDPGQPAMMTDVVKLLSAICIVGEENTHVWNATLFWSATFFLVLFLYFLFISLVLLFLLVGRKSRSLLFRSHRTGPRTQTF